MSFWAPSRATGQAAHAADVEHVVGPGEPAGDRGDVVFLGQDLLDLVRQRAQAGHEPGPFGGGHVPDPAEQQAEQRERGGHVGQRLGRGHRDLRAGVQEHAAAALAGDGAADHVDRAEDLAALALQLLHGHQRVQRLAGLADRDVQGVGVDDGIAVAELGRGLGVGGHPGQLLDQDRAHLARVVGRTAAQELDPPDRAEVACLQVDAAQARGGEPLVQPAAHDPAQRFGLLVDLLAHVVLVRAQLVVAVLGLDRHRLLAGLLVVQGAGLVAVGAHRGHFAVVQVDDLLGVPDQRGDVGGDEHLALPQAEHDGAAVARHHQLLGAADIEDQQAVGALDPAQGPAHRVLQRPAAGVQLARDQVGQRLGVGVGHQRDAGRGQLGPELLGVLDDAVVHDRDVTLGVQVRVRVDLVGLAVRGPAGVADADVGLHLVVDPVAQVLDAARGLGDLKLAPVHHRDASGVVAAVLQPVQTFQQHRHGLPAADVSDDSAHGASPSRPFPVSRTRCGEAGARS